jgi:hypothetical protein
MHGISEPWQMTCEGLPERPEAVLLARVKKPPVGGVPHGGHSEVAGGHAFLRTALPDAAKGREAGRA